MAAKKQTPSSIALVTTPAYPVPGRSFRLYGKAAHTAQGTHFRVWCTAAPVGTKLRKELDDSRAARVAVIPLLRISDDPATGPNRFEVELTLEKGGGYGFTVEEIQIGTGFTGGYESDPRGAPSEDIKVSGVTTLYVAAPLTMQLGCGQDTATLRLFVHNATVIQTEFVVHGETTPRVELSPSATPKARLAAESDDVRSAVAALAGETVTGLVGDLSASLDDLIGVVGAHFLQGGRHYVADDDNTIAGSFLGANSPATRAAALSELRRKLAQHMRNDDSSGTGSTGYHSAADWENLPLDAAAPADPARDAVSQADTWRAYEGHRVSSVHKAADAVNDAAALPPLLSLHRAFIAALVAANPTTPATFASGATVLISQLGFKDA